MEKEKHAPVIKWGIAFTFFAPVKREAQGYKILIQVHFVKTIIFSSNNCFLIIHIQCIKRGVSISKFSHLGRMAANKILVHLPLWPRGHMAATPNHPLITTLITPLKPKNNLVSMWNILIFICFTKFNDWHEINDKKNQKCIGVNRECSSQAVT